MPKKIDPLNKKQYCSVTPMLTVSDVKAAADFYQKAFGFAKRGIMNGPDGKAAHAELTLRGMTIMLGPEMPQMGSRSAKTVRRFAEQLVSADGKRRQSSCEGCEARGNPEGTSYGYVLGRPLRSHCRSRWLHMDGCHSHRRAHASGNEKEDEGANVRQTWH